MKNAKTIIRNILLFIIMIVITFVIVFKNYNIKDTFTMISNANILFIILAILCMVVYFICEGLNNKWILEGLGKKIGVLQSTKYSIIGFFFSGITPAAGGGQPMQVYFMNRDNIPSSYATLSLLVQLITFHTVTLVFGIFGFLFNYHLLSSGVIILFGVGFFLKLVVLVLMIICFRNRYVSKKLINFALKVLKKFKVKDIEEKEKNLISIQEDYNNGAKYIRKHKKIFGKSVCIIILQVVFYYTIPYLIYKSFGLNVYNWVEMLTLQAILYVSVASIPLPGSVGVSEGTFLSIYEYIYGTSVLASGMILNRTVSFYLFVLIGAGVTVYNFLKKSKKQKVSKKES